MIYFDCFPQGHALFDGDLNKFTSELGDEILEMKKKTATLEKHLEKRHTQVSLQGDSGPKVQTVGDEVKIEGYLFKRGQNAFRTWNRRWFYLKVRGVSFFTAENILTLGIF
jgi:Arf-GAP/coiled-coil/ANK repeat/PH domain-containing protein